VHRNHDIFNFDACIFGYLCVVQVIPAATDLAPRPTATYSHLVNLVV